MTNFTKEQIEIIDEATGTQSIMINALAGSGKTTTLLACAEVLPAKETTTEDLLNGNTDQKVLAIAFNARIKVELEQKLPKNITCLTFNGLGHRTWAVHIGKRLKLDRNKVYKILREVLNLAEFKHMKAEMKQDDFANFMDACRTAKQLGMVPPAYKETFAAISPWTVDMWDRILCEYDMKPSTELLYLFETVLSKNIMQALDGVIDFDDQIWLPLIAKSVFPKYHTVLVDEAQDISVMNRLQIEACKPERTIIFGDRYQSIYAFRGADPDAMDNLAEKFNAVPLTLNTSFRCPRRIVKEVRNHVEHMKAHEGNPEGQVRYWTDWSIENLQDGDAVLCRNNAPLLKLASAFMQQGRVPKILGRDVGKGLCRVLRKINVAQQQSDNPLPRFSAIDLYFSTEMKKAKAGRKFRLQDQKDCIIALLEMNPEEPLLGLCCIIERMFDEDTGTVTFATGHKSKGLEWKTVWHLDKHLIKTDQDEQECNLLYVINTRAMSNLFFIESKNCLDLNPKEEE